jgi:hypothetical protein
VLLACSVASPATEVREVLARAAPLELPAGDARVLVERAGFADVTVSMDGARALVVAVVEADGRARSAGRDVAIAYVGRERFAMERCDRARWCPVGEPLPALAGVIAALAAAPRPDGRRPVAWQIRVERERAIVGEDAAVAGGPSPRGRWELVLVDDVWRVAAGP